MSCTETVSRRWDTSTRILRISCRETSLLYRAGGMQVKHNNKRAMLANYLMIEGIGHCSEVSTCFGISGMVRSRWTVLMT